MQRGSLFGFVTAFEESAPRSQSRSVADGKSHFLQNGNVQSLALHQDGHLVDGRRVDALHHGIFVHIAEQSHFLAQGGTQLMFRTQYEDIGLDTGTLQFLYGVLGGLGLQFTGSSQVGDISKVYAQGVFSQFPLQLTDAFQIGQRLDVTHCTANLGNNKVEFVFVSQQFYITLDFVCNMGNNLNCLSQIVTPALFVDDAFVDASGRDIVGLGGLDAQEAFVMAQIEVGFVAIHGNVAFAVFIRVQCTRVDVDVRVKLLDGYLVTSCLQQFTDGG